MPTTLALLHQLPGLGGFALAALGLILSPVPVVWLSFHRRSVLLSRIDAQNLQTERQHAQRMFELETARKLGLREQDRLTLIATQEQARLDRSLEAEVAFLVQLTRRKEAEAGPHRAAVPPHQPAQAQVEKKAA